MLILDASIDCPTQIGESTDAASRQLRNDSLSKISGSQNMAEAETTSSNWVLPRTGPELLHSTRLDEILSSVGDCHSRSYLVEQFRQSFARRNHLFR